MNDITRAAFADELTKIAGALDVGRKALWAGWHGMKPDMSVMQGSGWRAGAGRISRYLPGGKSMAAITAAMTVPGVFGKDQSGQNRGHLERALHVAGSTLGGIAGSGLAMGTRLGRWSPVTGMIAGNLVGGSLGGRVATAPFAAARRALGKKAPLATDEGWRNTAPGGLNTTPDAVVGQAQAM